MSRIARTLAVVGIAWKQVELHTERLCNYFSNIAAPTTWNVGDWFLRD